MQFILTYNICRTIIINFQELEEPSSTENTNYDPLISAIVKPRDYYYYNVAGGGDTQVIIINFSFYLF